MAKVALKGIERKSRQKDALRSLFPGMGKEGFGELFGDGGTAGRGI